MQNEDQYTELFDRYLRRELNDTEMSAFDEKLLNDEAFNAAFIAHKTLVLGIRDYAKVQLKDYLKTHAQTVSDKSFNIGRIFYAIAAVLIVFLGIYAVFNYYTPNAQKSEISTTEISKKTTPEQAENEVPSGDIVTKTEKSLPIQKMEELPPPVSTVDDMSPLEETSDNGPVAASTGTEDKSKDLAEGENYSILTDKKISDTILLAINVSAEEIITRKMVSKADKEIERKKSLPANTYGGYNNKVNTVDTIVLKNKAAETITDKYVLEFWQSPINFKGYKMRGKTIQVFGIAGKQIKVLHYSAKTYLRNGTTFYLVSECPTGCLFKVEENQETINLLLRQ